MKASAIVLTLALFSSLCFADDVVGAGCTASVSLAARPNAAWNNGDGSSSQIYDITVVNAGSCPLDNVGLSFDTAAGTTITNSWNLQADSLYWLVSNFGPSIAVGSSTSAGFVLTIAASASSSDSTPLVHVYGAACPSSCVNGAPSSAPATSAPSSAPATSAPTSSSATSAPTGSATSSPVVPDCEGSAIAQPRSSPAPWTDAQGYTYQIYDIIANNSGTCSWTAVQTYFAGNITQSWNYDVSTGLLSGFGSSIAAGQVYNGAGFIFASDTTGLGLQAPTLGRMRPVCAAPCSE